MGRPDVTTLPDTGVTIVGVPFDATSTYRTGSRFAPAAIREAFANVEIYSRRLRLDLEALRVDDAGNLRHTANIADMVASTRESVAGLLKADRVPAILGGEHAITYATFGAFPAGTGLLVFDAHFDLRDEYDGLRLMHATYLRRLIDERPDLRVVHVGGRAGAREEWEFADRPNVALVTADEAIGAPDLATRVARLTREIDDLYVTIDLDGLDPAYAPGVANPEPGGLSSRELVSCLQAIDGACVRGFDIVELCPAYDPSGIGAAAAARFLAELCSVVHVGRGGQAEPPTVRRAWA